MIDDQLINFINFLADESSKIAIKYFRQPNDEKEKNDKSPVTKADQEIEESIRFNIKKKYPDHGIIGEEYEDINPNAKYKWIIDPIDGTSSFIIGRPIFGTLIALTYNNKPIIGILDQPISHERWIGISEIGSYFINTKLVKNNEYCQLISSNKVQKIYTRNTNSIDASVMCSSSPFYFQDQNDKKILQHLTSLTKYQKIGGIIYGGDCYSFACLAMGFVDIIIEPGLQNYDYAATQIIIEMAGGLVTDWKGQDLNLRSDARLLACSNKKLHQLVLKEITQAIN